MGTNAQVSANGLSGEAGMHDWRARAGPRCVISGGMQGGTIDVVVRTPDGKQYPIGLDGTKYRPFSVPSQVCKPGGCLST